jgi:serine/threonine protein kinase
VRKAIIKETGQTVAVKIVDREALEVKEEADLRQEVAIMRTLDHPNIVHMYDFFEHEDYFFLVLEYVAGGELFDRIVQKTCYSENEARALMKTLFGTVKYCHDKGIVHRSGAFIVLYAFGSFIFYFTSHTHMLLFCA